MMYKICIIGCGDRGCAHASVWTARDDSKVIAVCDIDTARVNRLAETHEATRYDDYESALAHDGIDFVSVCVPTYLHAPVIVAAASRGIHVMAEKPLALTSAQAVQIEEALRKSGVVYSACFQHRDRGFYLLLKDLVREGRFGAPIHFRFTDVRDIRPKVAMHRESQNGGVVIDMACHIFDLLRFLTGDEIVRVFATGHVFGQGKPSLSEVDDFAIDAAQIEVDTRSGHHGSLYINWGMPSGYTGATNGAELLGPAGGAREAPGEMIVTMGDHVERWPDSGQGSALRIERFVEAVEASGEPDIAYRDARITLDLSLSALESIQTRKSVEYEPYNSSS